jgi:hypothetical protein
LRSLAAILTPGLRFIRNRQLPSGEIACHAPAGEDLCYCPFPFWSAVAYDSLAFADPASPRFARRLLDLLPPGERRAIPAMVSAIRWRIRTYLASEEEADCTWRLHGRNSASPVDAATSGCAAEALLTPPRLGYPASRSRHVDPLRRRLNDSAIDAAGRCYILTYLSMAGEPARDIAGEVFRLCTRETEMLPQFWSAASRALNRAGLSGHGETFAVLTSLILAECAPDRNRTHQAMALSALLDIDHRGPEIPELIASVLDSAVNPAGWSWQSYALNGSGSAAATMSLMLAALFRASSAAGGAMLS